MKEQSFVVKVIQERGGGIRLIQATENDLACWFYVRIDEDKLSDYKEGFELEEMNVADYGEILESDWGDYPPRDVVHFMKEEYDFDTPKKQCEGDEEREKRG